jgi:predicted MFS family arabinose efflux permease
MLATARLQRTWASAAGRGMLLLGISMAAFGLALSAHENTVTNYFEDVLHFEGPQFGYITAIREVPGFLLIFLTALFYRMSLQRLTALALVVLAVGYVCFGLADSFWTVAPWVVLTSMGYHTVLQTRYALGMSLTTEANSGAVLGKINAIDSAGALAAMALVLVTFHYGWLSFRPLFVIAGMLALVGAVAMFFFPTLHEGKEQSFVPRRAAFVVRRPYRYYYYLSLLDGGRQQIFFSFGLWVLVHEYSLSVPQVSAILLAVRGLGMLSSTWIGRMVDRHGERAMLAVVNVGYVVALGGYALIHNVIVACICYLIYSLIFPLSTIGAATYLRKVAVTEEIAPSLAMGVTLQHAAAIVVPVSTGVILNYAGFEIPFLIACVFACFTFFVTQRLDPTTQKSPARIAQDAERAAALTPTAPTARPPRG